MCAESHPLVKIAKIDRHALACGFDSELPTQGRPGERGSIE